jgi:hypothetical protein
VTGESLFPPQLGLGPILWIRISTGQLCIEVNDNGDQDPTREPTIQLGDSIFQVDLTSDPNLGEKLFLNLSLDDIHPIFSVSGWWNGVVFALIQALFYLDLFPGP